MSPASGPRNTRQHSGTRRHSMSRHPASGRLAATALKPTRVLTLGCVFLAAMIALAVRLVYAHTAPDQRLFEDKTLDIKTSKSVIPATRGTITDRSGRVLAISVPSLNVFADPSRITDPLNTARTLTEHLDYDETELFQRFVKDSEYELLARQADVEFGEEILDLGLNGIYARTVPRRDNPNGDCSSLTVVGTVNIDNEGRAGLEKQHEALLAGVAGLMEKEVAADGATIPGGLQQITPAQPGKDLRLTLDRNVQHRTEQILAQAVAKANASTGIALAAIPSTGEIVTMANVERASNGMVQCTRKNWAAVWSYDPGSVMKPITMAAVLKAGDINPATEIVVPEILRIDYTENGKAKVKEFKDPFTHDGSELSVRTILSESSNIGTILLAQEAGEEALYNTVNNFGFGKRSTLDFPLEHSGQLNHVDNWNILSLPTLAIGQGISVTPVQLLQAYSTIANDGIMAPLHLVADDNNGADATSAGTTADSHDKPQPVQITEPQVAKMIQDMLGTVVDDGTGTAASFPGFDVSGKTGTSWQVCDDGYECVDAAGEYVGRYYTATFAGIISNDEGPQLVVVVVIDNPTGPINTGGAIAAPVASQIGEYAVQQLRIQAMSGPSAPARLRAEPAPAPVVDEPSDLEILGN